MLQLTMNGCEYDVKLLNETEEENGKMQTIYKTKLITRCCLPFRGDGQQFNNYCADDNRNTYNWLQKADDKNEWEKRMWSNAFHKMAKRNHWIIYDSFKWWRVRRPSYCRGVRDGENYKNCQDNFIGNFWKNIEVFQKIWWKISGKVRKKRTITITYPEKELQTIRHLQRKLTE